MLRRVLWVYVGYCRNKQLSEGCEEVVTAPPSLRQNLKERSIALSGKRKAFLLREDPPDHRISMGVWTYALAWPYCPLS